MTEEFEKWAKEMLTHPPEAPVWFSSEAASAWQAGFCSGLLQALMELNKKSSSS